MLSSTTSSRPGASTIGGILQRLGRPCILAFETGERAVAQALDFDLARNVGERFEEERDLLRRPAVSTGASPRYEWDAMYAWLTWFLYEKGIPDTKTAVVVLVQDWFVQNSKSGEVPDESTIRKRLTSLWHRLRGEEPA